MASFAYSDKGKVSLVQIVMSVVTVTAEMHNKRKDVIMAEINVVNLFVDNYNTF